MVVRPIPASFTRQRRYFEQGNILCVGQQQKVCIGRGWARPRGGPLQFWGSFGGLGAEALNSRLPAPGLPNLQIFIGAGKGCEMNCVRLCCGS